MAQKLQKAKYWVAVLYPESMIDFWQDEIDVLLQLPYCYCIHDKDTLSDTLEDRKVHIHLIIAFQNTTTFNHALSVFQRLQPNCSFCEQVINIRYMYDYLIHNTKDCERKNKYKYAINERISGNNFDIGNYEQLSISDKRALLLDLCEFIKNHEIDNFMDFYRNYSIYFPDSAYFEVIMTYSGLLERLCKGNYLNSVRK